MTLSAPTQSFRGDLTALIAQSCCLSPDWPATPNETWLYDAKQGFSKSFNSPWSGQKLTGRVKTTIVSGKVVFWNSKLV